MSFPSDVRAYFDERIKTIDTDLIALDDALNDEPISNTEADKGYKMVLGSIATELGPNFHTEFITVNLTIFARPLRCEIDSFDVLYCKAQDIKDAIVNKKNQDNYTDKNWNQIAPVSIIPSSEDTDDKLFRMDLEFSIRRDIAYI